MSQSDDPLDDLTGPVLDGKSVEWDQTESDARLDPKVVRALRDLWRIAEFNRALQGPPAPGPTGEEGSPAMSGFQPKRWGNLLLLESMGAGARGEVWRAWDGVLERHVALKFLLPLESAPSGGVEDLLNEARALAQIRHRGVVTVHGIALNDGRPGMWMECLQGVTLAHEIDRLGSLPVRQVVHIALELCSALEALEASGIVHRDIKPANIMLEPDGRVALTDFGLGWRPSLREADAPRSSGTPMFMAPELLSGGVPTHQSDVYALGITLWWSLAGESPFQTRSLEELQQEVAKGPQKKLRALRADAPPSLIAAVEWASNPVITERPRSAAHLGALLRRAQEEIDVKAPKPRRRSLWVAALGLTVAAVLTGALVLGRHLLPWPVLNGSGGPPSVAVLPLANVSGDPSQDYFSDGVTDELITRLAQVGGLRVISHSSVLPFKNLKQPPQQIARRLGVKMLVDGTATRFRDRVRISAHLVDARSGREVWAQVYDRRGDDVFAIQSDIAKSVVRGIEARVTPRERSRLALATPIDPEAHALYLHGLAAYREQTRDGIERAIALFRKATAIDSTYVDAWTGLAYAYDYAKGVSVVSVKQARAESIAAARRALMLDPENGRAWAILASMRFDADWDFQAAERSYREALALSPNDAEARAEYVILLVGMQRFDDAIREARTARQNDPLSSMAANVSLFPLFEGRRYAEAVRAARDVLKEHPDFSPAMLVLGEALFFSGHRQEGIATLEKTVQLDPTGAPTGWLGLVYGLAGKREQAIEVRNRLVRMGKKEFVDPYFLAIVDVGLGETRRALDELDRSPSRGEMIFIRSDPALDPLRREPRFHAILRRLGMEA